MKDFCGAIQYMRDNTDSVHSDICLHRDPAHSEDGLTDDYRKFLHDCLDEWLNNSNGTGCFWVGDPVEMTEEFSKDLIYD